MSDQKFNQSVKHFCGESNATGLFMEATYPLGNYSVPINNDTNPELFGTSLENVLLVKNYNSSAKQPGMLDKARDNDVHNQYVDFIVRTALFHREIDNPTTMGSGLADIRKSFEEASSTLLGDKLATLADITDIRKLIDATMWTYAEDLLGNATPLTPVGANITLRALGVDERSTFNQYVNAVVLLLVLSLRNAGTKMPIDVLNNAANNLKAINMSMPELTGATRSSVISGRLETESFLYLMTLLLGSCDDVGKLGSGIFGKYCLITTYMPASGTPVAQNIQNILNRNAAGSNSAIMTQINDTLLDVFVEHSARILNSAGGIVSVYNDFWDSKNANDAIQGLKAKLTAVNNDNALNNALHNDVTDKVYNVARKNLNVRVDNEYTTLDKNDYADQLFTDVFINWPNLHSQAREFYRQHLRIFRRVGATKSSVVGEEGWAPIGDRVDDNNYIRSLDKTNIRLNLMKIQGGSDIINFANTLPFLPVSGPHAVTGLWYTNNSKIVTQYTAPLTTTFLRDLYTCVYNAGTCSIPVPSSYKAVEGNTSDFDVNDVNVIKNLIRSRQAVPQPTVTQMGQPSFNDFFVEDMITRAIYLRDATGGLYRMANGQKVDYNTDNIKLENCAGTYLHGDQVKCVKFVRDCLLNGDKNSLGNCLSNLTNANMFAVAQHELVNVDPKVAIEILRTFGVQRVVRQDPVHGSVSSPLSFDSWKENVLSGLKQNVKDAILNNFKLCEYLKGVIAFVTANPAILNPHMVGSSAQSSLADQPIDDPYIKALKKTLWVNPIPESKDAKLFESEFIVKSMAQSGGSYSSMATMPYRNVTYAQGTVISPHGMMGGASSFEESVIRKIKKNGPTSELITALMDSVVADLKGAGIKLNENDLARMKNGTVELNKIEKKLYGLYGMLRTLTDLASFFNASGCAPNANQTKEISINQIKNRADTLTYLKNNIGEAQNCIGNNITQQNAKCGELLKYYSTLVGAANNGTDQNVIEVANM